MFAHNLLIVQIPIPTEIPPAITAWLRNDRRLGMAHYACPAPELSADKPSPREPIARAEAPSRRADDRSAGRPAPAWHEPRPAPASRPAPETMFGEADAAPPRSAPRPLPIADRADLAPLNDRDLSVEEAAAALAELDRAAVKNCTTCRLHEKRTQTVFGVGHPRAELMFVGEGPGADEDAQGEPFVGKAGQLLTRMIAAMTLTREQVYIANTVKCRPPGNRTPVEDEMAACWPYLARQIAIIRPKLIVALGRPATQTLLATTEAISKIRGREFPFPPPSLATAGLPHCTLIPTFHPAYLLRSPDEKAKAWADLQIAMRFLGLKLPGK